MGDVKKDQARRRYQSPLREENARRTRAAIVAAATQLFVTRGYTGASLADVAAAAGVARPTVFAAFGSKSALLHEVLDQALAGNDEAVPVAERPWFRPVWKAPNPPAVLAAYAQVCTLIGSRTAQLFEVVRRAADTTEEAAGLWDTLQRNRRSGALMVVEHLQRLGPLQDHVETAHATDILWVFNDPALYDALVTQCGWGEPTFTDWLAAGMRDAILPR